jgi:hypothetical protein
MEEYDTSLVFQAGYIAMRFPAPLSRSLAARQYNRARITITNDGLIVRPYRDKNRHGATVDVAELPDWKDS